MTLLKALLSFVVINAAQCAGHDARQSMPEMPTILGPTETLGAPFPAGAVYVPINVSDSYLAMAASRLAFAMSGDTNCADVAASKGAHFYGLNPPTSGVCGLGLLQFPFCPNFGGSTTIYFLQNFISNRTTSENGYIGSLSAMFPSYLREIFAGSFRIQMPTILDFPEFLGTPLSSPSFQVVYPPNAPDVTLDSSIVADPACFTNNSCAVPFLQFQFASYSRPPYKFLRDLCWKKVLLGAGKQLNIFSHARIGCTYFPNEGFAGFTNTACRVIVRSKGPLKFKMTYVNFVAQDKCDGFNIAFIVTDDLGKRNVTHLCRTPITEMDAPAGEGMINFSGKSVANRTKYGFIINISSA